MIALLTPFLLSGGAFAASLLRRSWQDRKSDGTAFVIFGWAVATGLALASMWLIGPVKGLATALAMEALGAIAVIITGHVRRRAVTKREFDAAPEPLAGPSKIWRGILKTLLAGPLGMVAAMGLAFCYTALSPGAPQTRIVIGGLLLPILWGLAMTWTLADQKLLRATAVLTGTALISFTLAALAGSA
ncbi:hypothetical protein [Altericroceibacterium spongiae]|uniref:hypothetical protein n=1 Tax=Altericroceibacterium spongiae TaxID=2320269 RepID=UPI0026D08724